MTPEIDSSAITKALSSGAEDGRQSEFLSAKLGACQPGMSELLADAIADLTERERLSLTLYYYQELGTLEFAPEQYSNWSDPH
jgi:DNA-directed RNA polymerase specialized sigma subunit